MNKHSLGNTGATPEAGASALPTETRQTIRLGWIAIAIFLGGFLVWAALAPLDEGVPASATVTFESKRKTIQHMTGGIVERVAVHEGQHVNAGDLLVELNDGVAKANFESIRQNYMALRANESRLLAELEGRATIGFHKDLMAASDNPLIRQHILTQTQLFDSRRSALREELNMLDENIAGQEATLAGINRQQESRAVQAAKQAEQLKNISELASEGYVPRNQALQLEQGQAELRALIAELQANKLRTERSVAELKMRKTFRRQEIIKEVAGQLAEVQREVQADREKLDAATGELGRVMIKSPVAGQVIGLSIASIGGVVTPGQRLLDVVPNEEGVLLEAKIPTHVIDRIRVDDTVAVRFSAFAHTPQLVVDAKMISLSGDIITEQVGAGVASFYLARIKLTTNGIRQLGEHQLQAGMGAEVIIRTGERSMLAYILHPLTKRISSALKEE
jgi:protease secretion system membrane fusion protein